jgi:hypothetical protein
MEYKELEILWKQFDEKLDKLEKINKKLLKNTLLQKPQRKLNWLEFRSLYGVIATPIILLVALHPNFKAENIDWILILGCIITFTVVLYLCIMILRSYLIVKKIDLYADSVIKSLNEITKLKEISNTLQKSVFIHYPVLGVGVIMIGWNSFVFSTNTIVFLSVFFIIRNTQKNKISVHNKNKLQR